MSVWRRLACSLPPQYFEATDLNKLLVQISRYTGLSIDNRLTREKMNQIGSCDCRPDRDETWFTALRNELAKWGVEVIVQPPGLLVRTVDDSDRSDWDDPDFPDTIQVSYKISDLPIRSEHLEAMIYNLIHADTWSENGGDGDCTAVTSIGGRFLIVRHHEAMQASVLMFLETLAMMCVEPTNIERLSFSSSIRDGLIRSAMQPHTQELVSLLESPTPEFLRRQLPLPGLMKYLQSRGITVHHERPSVTEWQELNTAVIDLRQNRGSFYNDVNHSLSQFGMSLSVRENRVDFEIFENREPDHELAIYDSTVLQVSDEAMRTVLQVIVSPDEWAENGGAGELVIRTVGARQLVVVCQPPHLQWQVRRFLDRLAQFVDQSDPTKNRWTPKSKPSRSTATHGRASGSSRAIPLPNAVVPRFAEPDEFSADSWPVHELQADFWPHRYRRDNLHRYPTFYDITPWDVDDEVVYELLHGVVNPSSWETNGGGATSLIERFGAKKILITRASSADHDAVARFVELVSRTLGGPPVRSNWRMEWVRESIRTSSQIAGLDAADVEVFELPSSIWNLEAIRQLIMKTIEPDTWSENGGDYELLFARINQRLVLVVYHQRHVHQTIRRYLLDLR